MEQQQQELSLGTKIRHLRAEAEMTQQALSALAKCSASYISRLEGGDVMPTVKMLANIAGVFGKTVGSLTQPAEGEKQPGNQQQIWEDIQTERRVQDVKYGGPAQDDNHSGFNWLSIFTTHLGKFSLALWHGNTSIIRKQLVRLAAIAVAAIEWCDRKGASKNE